jgi:hypothetical protein
MNALCRAPRSCRLSFLALCLLLASCSSTKSYQVDNALLAEVSSEEKAEIQTFRAERDRAADAAASSEREVRAAENRVELARAALETERTRMAQAKLGTSIAKKDGTAGGFEKAERFEQQVAAEVDAKRAALGLRKRELEHAKLTDKLAQERVMLTSAEVELAKAKAVQNVDRMAVKKIDLSDFEKQVAFHRKGVEDAIKLCTKSEERVAQAQSSLETAQTKAVSFRTPVTEKPKGD